jgi:hypothetical protein
MIPVPAGMIFILHCKGIKILKKYFIAVTIYYMEFTHVKLAN